MADRNRGDVADTAADAAAGRLSDRPGGGVFPGTAPNGERAQKKGAILDAAFDIFLEKGFDSTKMSDIAGRAGIAKATLYEYFESKEGLFDELLDSKIILPYCSFGERIDRAAPCEAQLRQFMQMEMDFMRGIMMEKKVMPNILLQIELMGNPTVVSAARRIMGFKFRLLLDIISSGMDSGEFRQANPVAATACLIGAFNFYNACLCGAEGDCYPILGDDLPKSREDFFMFVFNGLE
ncbi:MAG: TetR/AcrR family transcriptional regulator [Clostridiales Family XIII bacterium]|jgi:AcrR family transcriptional regulator|nr:TetR/AcrR family transcriptional regulator [Clostridiales Family XIII bacterium]